MNELPEEVKKYMADLGKKGGKTTGESKRRDQKDPDHYKKIRPRRPVISGGFLHCPLCEKMLIAYSDCSCGQKIKWHKKPDSDTK